MSPATDCWISSPVWFNGSAWRCKNSPKPAQGSDFQVLLLIFSVLASSVGPLVLGHFITTTNSCYVNCWVWQNSDNSNLTERWLKPDTQANYLFTLTPAQLKGIDCNVSSTQSENALILWSEAVVVEGSTWCLVRKSHHHPLSPGSAGSKHTTCPISGEQLVPEIVSWTIGASWLSNANLWLVREPQSSLIYKRLFIIVIIVCLRPEMLSRWDLRMLVW